MKAIHWVILTSVVLVGGGIGLYFILKPSKDTKKTTTIVDNNIPIKRTETTPVKEKMFFQELEEMGRGTR